MRFLLLALLSACGRNAGPAAGETVAWAVAELEIGTDGCGGAGPIVDAVARVYAPGTGLVYVVSDDGTTAETVFCPLVDGAFDLDACEGGGDVGSVEGSAVEWEIEEVVVDAPPCSFVMDHHRRIEDGGDEATLAVEVTVSAALQNQCAYTFEAESVHPDGCVVTASGALQLSDAAR